MSIEKLSYRTTVKKLAGDTLTPILIFNRLKGQRKFLLESSAKSEESGRYSFIGENPLKSYSGSGQKLIEKQFTTGKSYEYMGDLLTQLKRLMPRITEQSAFPFTGGAVGYIGYGAAKIDSILDDELDLPDVNFQIYETIIIFDHLEDAVTIMHTDVNPEQEKPDLKAIAVEISTGNELIDKDYHLSEFQSNVTREKFESQVQQALQHIQNGEVEQVVLSRQLAANFTGNPFSIYRKLRKQNPSPYMYYMEFDQHILIGASPESVVSVTNHIVKVNPIAGTVSRGQTIDEDEHQARKLLNDPKEIAEHNMLLDEARQELTCICAPATIRVKNYMEIVRFEHVMHLMSNVEGKLSPVLHALDALSATFPTGTVTGKPKHLAMAIIDEIETTHRSTYGGAIGYIGFNGNIDFAITIRSMLVKNNKAFIQAGAGIVKNSIPSNEFDETEAKAKSLITFQGE
ncbi:anthranilate synthase component I family protein [Viridibacillus arvi]|uniref:anthranilate synthase component I family protein n=1 Tax=Viridibacillus arvi TaxID=263475 RepID=UPI003D07D2C3